MKNDFKLRGFVVHENVNEKRAFLLVRPGYWSRKIDSVMVLLFGDVLESMKEQNIEKYSYVEIAYNVQSRKTEVLDNGSRSVRYSQIPIAESIKKVEQTPLGDFDEPGGYPLNEGVLEGELINIYRLAENVLRITIKTIKNDRISFVQCYRVKSNTQNILDRLKKGQIVHAECIVRNKKREKDGDIQYHQDVEIQRITILEDI